MLSFVILFLLQTKNYNLLEFSGVIIDINYAKFCEYSLSNINDIKY